VKFTAPLGVYVPEPDTVTLKVALPPAVTEAGVTVIAVVDGKAFTVSVAVPLELAKLRSPL
jgi:hypothetical protein